MPINRFGGGKKNMADAWKVMASTFICLYKQSQKKKELKRHSVNLIILPEMLSLIWHYDIKGTVENSFIFSTCIKKQAV